MLIDTHCHLNMMVKEKFGVSISEKELDAVGTIVKDAKKHQVEVIITVGTNFIENNNCVEIAKHYPHVFASVGLHPTDCSNTWRTQVDLITPLLREKEKNNIVAVGECGLDFYWPGYNIQQQKDLFKAQIELALEYDLALTIHTRNASEETIEVLEEFKGQIKGVLHCFSENLAYAEQIIDIGLFLGIGGTITYPKNDQLREVIENLPLEHIVLETDAPWLPPQTARGKQNHPRYINEIARYLANLKKITYDSVAQKTTKNAQSIFRLH